MCVYMYLTMCAVEAPSSCLRTSSSLCLAICTKRDGQKDLKGTLHVHVYTRMCEGVKMFVACRVAIFRPDCKDNTQKWKKFLATCI